MAKKGQTITRYSHNPLAKKFKCPQCGNWFRTLQGLSGHVRFRHGVYENQGKFVIELQELQNRKEYLVVWCKAFGLSGEIIEARLRVLDRWVDLLTYCHSFDVRLGAEDFKKYVIDSFWHGLGTGE